MPGNLFANKMRYLCMAICNFIIFVVVSNLPNTYLGKKILVLTCRVFENCCLWQDATCKSSLQCANECLTGYALVAYLQVL